jgi:threonine/homoserine/homoserine lactone efflux protein
MPDPATYGAFLAALAVLLLTPGPDVLLVVSRGIGQGRRTALLTAVGMTLVAGLVQIPLVTFGVAGLLRSSPLAFDLLRWAGAAYLIGLGLRVLLQRHRAPSPAAAATRVSPGAALVEGAISNLTNPKSLLFMLAFLPQFVDPTNGSAAGQLFVLATTQKVLGLISLGSFALTASAAGAWLARRPGFVVWQERFTGAIMIVLGLRLLFAGDARPSRA